MRRRGSSSANMKPTVAVVQGQQQESSSDRDDNDMRRASEPSFHGMTNVGFAAPQRPPQPQNIQTAASQPQNSTNMRWLPQPQQAFGQRQQANTYRHSFASSMDLISSNSMAHSNGNSTTQSQPLQSNLFRSSSHHTSHTAAAGDLLTMSRRALAPPPSNPSQVFAKKRSATMADANANGSNHSQISFMSMNVDSNNRRPIFGSTNGSNSQIIVQHHTGTETPQHHTGAGTPQQQVHSPMHSITIGQLGGGLSNTQDELHLNGHSSSAFQFAANVSSSTVGTMGDKEEAYQHHRTIRRCRRSDSFEMMEDG